MTYNEMLNRHFAESGPKEKAAILESTDRDLKRDYGERGWRLAKWWQQEWRLELVTK